MLDSTPPTPLSQTPTGTSEVTDLTPPTTLIETSFADAIRRIEEAPELAEHRRQHWPCSLRQIGKGLDRPWSSSRLAGPQFGSGSRNSITRGWD